MTTDKEHMKWIYDRMTTRGGDSYTLDYMQRLLSIIKAMPEDVTSVKVDITHLSSSIDIRGVQSVSTNRHANMVEALHYAQDNLVNSETSVVIYEAKVVVKLRDSPIEVIAVDL